MSEKYTPEKLAAMKSIGFNKSGRIRHNQAGVPIRESLEQNHQRVTIDEGGNVYKDNADGTQDLTLNPKPVKVEMKASN